MYLVNAENVIQGNDMKKTETTDDKIRELIEEAAQANNLDAVKAALKEAERRQKAERADFMRATFLIRKDHLEELRAHAEADRTTQKELLDKILREYFERLGGGKNGKR